MDWLPDDIAERVRTAPFHKLHAVWEAIEEEFGTAARRALARADRYYLLCVVLHRPDAYHPWLHARCRDVESNPDGYLDLWAREHYKSTIITFAGAIQEIIRDPEITIGIFSYKAPAAKKFLNQIKEEMETNEELKGLFPDILYAEPRKESTRWSREKGLVVRRTSNPKEATLEAHGLVEGMPTGAHYALRIYDDVVTPASVTSPEMVKKTTEAWSLSDNLGARGANGKSRAWHIGTRYTFADTYNDILQRKALTPRIYPATDSGLASGKPVFLSDAVWEDKKRMQIDTVLAAQMLQNPAAGATVMFQKDWLRFADVRPATLNVYIMADPASSRKAGSDNTAIAVVGIDANGNRYLLDGYHHKMSLSERWDALRSLRRFWKSRPGVQLVKVGYERYGMTSDMEYFAEKMRETKEHFEIVELAYPREGGGAKLDRIQRLQPYFKQGQFYLAAALPPGKDGKPVLSKSQTAMRERGEAYRIFQPVRRKDHAGGIYSLNKNFLDEYLVYPFSTHDDFLDAVSRIQDMEPVAPIIVKQQAQAADFVDGA